MLKQSLVLFALALSFQSTNSFAEESFEDPADDSDDAVHLRHDVIYNGNAANPKGQVIKATYQLSFAFKSKELEGANFPSCSATLIAKDVLLTAAHCIPDLNASDIYIKYFAPGAKRRSQLKAVEIVKHPAYSTKETERGVQARADIALLRLEREIPGGVPAQLPKADFKIADGSNVLVAGFGLNGRPERSMAELMQDPEMAGIIKKIKETKNPTEDQKKKMVLELMSLAELKPLLIGNVDARLVPGQDGPHPQLRTFGHNHVCKGDSGGPTYLQGKTSLVVIGVHSTATDADCAGKSGGFLGLFATREFAAYDTWVPAYLGWIKATVQKFQAGRNI